MSKTLINFWLDLALACLFLTSLWLAFVLRFVFPAGTLATDWLLWGATYDQWCEMQFVMLCLLGLAVLVHVMLHWTWVCGVLTSKLLPRRSEKKRSWSDGERTLIGVGTLIVILHVLAIALAAAKLTVEAP